MRGDLLPADEADTLTLWAALCAPNIVASGSVPDTNDAQGDFKSKFASSLPPEGTSKVNSDLSL